MKYLIALLLFTVSLHAVEVIQGQNVIGSVTCDGTAPFTYEWSKNGVFIPNNQQSTLVFTNIQPADAASYSVKVSNSAGSTTASLVLTVKALPPPVVPPSNPVLTFKQQLAAWIKKYFGGS